MIWEVDREEVVAGWNIGVDCGAGGKRIVMG